MVVHRTDIEKALDELISNEEGMRFQGIAVVLAKQWWPEFVACERKKDLGLDAYASSSISQDGIGKGLACSLTATLGKIKNDAEKVKKYFDDVKILVFATPQQVTNYTAKSWINDIRETLGYELIIIPREDIISSLMLPSNAPICRSQLRIPVSIESEFGSVVERVRNATSELTANWLKHPRISGRPLIALKAVRIAQEEARSDEMLSLNDIQSLLTECRRVVLEAPAGRGKTTALIQLATRDQDVDRVSFLIDLREWADSGLDILDFIASSPEFRSHSISAEDLAKLVKVTHISFLLNGWNEVSASVSERAEVALRRLERSFPTAGIIVATRNHNISPPLPGAIRAELLPLTRMQRREYLQKRVGSRATEIISKIENDPVLDELTQTFLFLAEVATIFESGRPIPPTKMGVLCEVISLLEQSEEQSTHLQRLPLKGRASEYLEGLAIQMTAQSATRVSRQEACVIISSVSQRLKANGQIETLPDPDDILNILCAHHILERPYDSSNAFSFEHQQFQEFYAAKLLERELWELAQSISLDQNREFTRQYVNKSSWEEPFCMVAEEIGIRSADAHSESDDVKAGKLLIEMALSVDPIFAAKLSHLCGEKVWKRVRTVVIERLRSWYQVGDERHRQCAVAGMLASGSEEFSDIILSLLTSDDQQVRLRAYRAWPAFNLSSLGVEWRSVVKGWNEDARIDFIGELSTGRWISSEAVVDFALADPSPKVRAAAVSMLSWCGADQDLARLLKDLDEESFEEAVREIPLESIPILLQPRALTVYRKLLNESTDVMNCIRILLRLAKLGDTNIPEKLKYELTRLPSDRINDQAEYVIRPALEVVRKTEPEWASHWVVGRIAGGSLRQKDWMTFVSSIPENLKAELLAGIGSKELQYNRLSDIIAAQAAIGDFSLVDAVFTKLCDARRDISDDARAQDQAKWAIVRQLEDILQSLPPDLAVASLSNCFTREFDVVEFIAVIKVFGGFDSNAPDLRDRLQDDLRQNLRTYLKNGVRFALKQDDPSGEMKAHLATALARVGEPEDMLDLRQLIRADIERIRNGISARARGEQSALAKWCQNMYDNWYVRAIAVLDTKQAGAVLMELLLEPEYENMAASALVRLAIIRNTENQFRHGTDYRIVWDARAGRRPNQFDEESRCLYATAIKQRIYSLLNEREYSIQTAFYNFRLKELARVLAKLDSHNSAELVLQIIALPGEWDGWHRVEALEALLLNGAELPAEETLRALNPVIEQVCADGLYNNQNVRLVTRCLCLLPFINVPSIGIGRMRQVLSSARIPPHELREMITALGQSRCQEALTLLRELAGTSEIDMQYIFGEWISAVAILGVPESERILLGFIDPDVDGFDIGTEKGRNGKNEVLVSCIADLAQRKFEIKQRLFRLCEIQRSPTVRIMLSKVIFRLGAVDAILAGLNLIDDNATPPIPYDLRRAIENFFLERYPQVKTENDHTLLRQGSIEIREKLFEMTLREVRRKKSAIALLGQIEVWRLEYGKPVAEPRHPAFDSGELWPPIQMTGAINCDV